MRPHYHFRQSRRGFYLCMWRHAATKRMAEASGVEVLSFLMKGDGVPFADCQHLVSSQDPALSVMHTAVGYFWLVSMQVAALKAKL